MLLRLLAALALLLATSARADDDKNYHQWWLDLSAMYDSNYGLASKAASTQPSNGEVRASIGFQKGSTLWEETSGGTFNAFGINLGADAELRGATASNNLSQFIPDLYINAHLMRHGWVFDLWLQGAYHIWGSDQPTAIEPMGKLEVKKWFVNALPVSLVGGVNYQYDQRISRASDAAVQNVYNGISNTGRAWLSFGCNGDLGCPGIVPNEIRLMYIFSIGDFVSVSPASPDAAAVAKATAPSNVFDNDHGLGYQAYRLSAVEHTLQLKMWFTTHLWASYEHFFLLDGAFSAGGDRLQAGLHF